MEALLQDKNLKRVCILIILSLWAWSVFGGTTAPGDSVGMKKIADKSFIIYRMDKGETAYAVSRKYGIAFKDIASANEGVDMGALKVGQQILVPFAAAAGMTYETAPVVEEVKKEEPKAIVKEEPVEVKTVVVETPVNNVNNLPEEKVEVTPVTSTTLEVDETGAVVVEEIPTATQGDKTKTFAMLYADYQSTDMIASYEKGVATWIENNGIEAGGDRFYALHNMAPIGSVVKVRNMMNNRIIYAKVIGTLSETEVKEKVMIKLSAGAAERLNVLDNRFIVEITYYQTGEEKAAK